MLEKIFNDLENEGFKKGRAWETGDNVSLYTLFKLHPRYPNVVVVAEITVTKETINERRSLFFREEVEQMLSMFE